MRVPVRSHETTEKEKVYEKEIVSNAAGRIDRAILTWKSSHFGSDFMLKGWPDLRPAGPEARILRDHDSRLRSVVAGQYLQLSAQCGPL